MKTCAPTFNVYLESGDQVNSTGDESHGSYDSDTPPQCVDRTKRTKRNMLLGRCVFLTVLFSSTLTSKTTYIWKRVHGCVCLSAQAYHNYKSISSFVCKRTQCDVEMCH